ncbi:integral membrane protein 2A-like [Ptychodera flava]|uniref:integral membrane protein 2A-like n=1 Tax=Ptychodera flava TaxID=63121 RepID=UPI00396A5FDD
MVKLGVYSADPDEKGKDEKDLKKEDDLKKAPEEPIFTHVKVVPEGVVPAKKKTCCTTRRVLLALFLILLAGTAIVAGALAFEFFDDDDYEKEEFNCRIDFNDPEKGKQEGRPRPDDQWTSSSSEEDVDVPLPVTKPGELPPNTDISPSTTAPPTGSLDENVEVDEEEETERFEIPSSEECEAVTIMHDFSVGLSAYRLWDSGRCFVKPLSNLCMPRFMLAQLMRDPNYLRQHFEMVRESYLAVPPPVEDILTLGPFIADKCFGFPTYWLEPVTEPEDEPEPVLPFESSEEMSSIFGDWPWFDPDRSGRRPGGRHRRGDFEEGNFLDKSKMSKTKIRYFDSDNKVKETQFYFK